MEEEKQPKEFHELTTRDIKYIKWDINKKTMKCSVVCGKWGISYSTYMKVRAMRTIFKEG